MYYDCWQFENWRLFLAARILMYFTTEIYPDPVGLKWLMWQYSEVQWQIHLWSCAMTGAGLFWTCVCLPCFHFQCRKCRMWSSKALHCHCGKRWQQGGLWVKATVHLKMNMFFQKPFDEIFLWNTKADVCFPYNICQSLKTILSVCFSHKSICDNKIRGNCDLSHHSDLFSHSYEVI